MSEAEATQAPIVLADLGKEALRDLLGNLTQAKAFVLEQAPEFCQQLVARDSILAFTMAGTFLAICVPAAMFANYFLRAAFRGEGSFDQKAGLVLASVVSCLTTVGAFIGFVVNVYCGLYIHLAPKVYLVEKLMEMIK